MHVFKLFKSLCLVMVCVSLITACSRPDGASSIEGQASSASRPETKVLATVNATSITDLELKSAIDSLLDNKSAAELSVDQRQTILESLVASRAIAQISEKEMSAEALHAVEIKTRAYREQLLVKKYIARHAEPKPVTQRMVKEYYEAHPEKFGAKHVRKFEMIFSRQTLASAERDALLAVMKEGGRQKDWRNWSTQLISDGHAVKFHQGRVEEQALEPELRDLVKPLKKDEVSNVSFIRGKAYLVRITDDVKLAPRPLNEVSARIRKALLPTQLKSAVSQVSDEAMQQVDVTYVNAIEGKNS